MAFDPEGNPAGFDNCEFDIELTNLQEDFCIISPQKRLGNTSFGAGAMRRGSIDSMLPQNQSTTAKSSTSNLSANAHHH